MGAKRKIPAVDKCDSCGCEYTPTGTHGRCLPCRRKYDREWRAKRKAEGRPIREYHAAYEAQYFQKPENRQRRAERARDRYQDEHHQAKLRVWTVTRNAIRRGELVRSLCEVCGNPRTEAHHDDYTRPLDVRWLCRSHHAEHHSKTWLKESE